MELTNLKISEFSDLLASDAPAPGGGAAAALAGSLGTALIEMVASLTLGKDKYKEFELLIEEISVKSKQLRMEFNNSITRDAEAFSLVSAAYKMEKDTPAKVQKKKAALEEGLKQAATVPLELMELALKAVCLCKSAVGKSNPNVSGDLHVSAVLLEAAAKSGFINVQANLPFITDAEFVKEYDEKSRRLLEEITKISDTVWSRPKSVV